MAPGRIHGWKLKYFRHCGNELMVFPYKLRVLLTGLNRDFHLEDTRM